jgi:glycosyltransferase involved in cell wall biosynthesis
VRILVWHGWLLEGSGSNVYTAKVTEAWREMGHDVVVLCQQDHPHRFPFVDRYGVAGPNGVDGLAETGVPGARGTVVMLRPRIGDLLPVFVEDHYEGFRVKRFVDLDDGELADYLERNVDALRAVGEWRNPDAVVADHLVPGPVVARRALGDGTFVAKVHGSDLEYAVRLQRRYAELGEEGVAGARAVVGASRDVLARTEAVAPSARGRTVVIEPGVDVERWRPRQRSEALRECAARLEGDPETARGRPSVADRQVRDLLRARDSAGLDALSRSYDHAVPDPDAAGRLRSLSECEGPVVGYFGKLIPEKGVERLLEAAALLGPDVRVVVVGFGLGREWLSALVAAIDDGDVVAHRWLAEVSPLALELDQGEVREAAGFAERVTFTGRLDHRYAPEVVAALDVLVVPSTLEEAFGMVAAEGAAAAAVPLVARHSSLAEVARALEGAAGRPGFLGFEPGPGATRRLAEGLERLLRLPPAERKAVKEAVRDHVASHWTWDRTATRLLDAATR